MAQCAKCGKELDAEAKFCLICGTPVEEAIETDDSPDPFKTVVKDAPAYGVVNLEQLPEGHLIDDRYEVKGKLGQGGFGAVYRVFDRKMECEKALKILPEAVASDRAAMVGLKKEAVTMAKLNHPGIVHVYDFCDTGSIKYIDMEFVAGASLSDALLDAPEGRFDEDGVRDLARQLAEGLAYAHTQGVIHKDIKAQNILITKDGTPKITDFGISETVKSSMSRIANSSSSGTLVYMAPEQIRGKDVGRESDIYSFGALLYELLSGHPPFYKGAIEHQILSEPVPPLEGVSDALSRFVLRCLEKEYTDRFRSFDEVLAALDGNEVPKGSTSGETPESKGKVLGKPMWMVAAAVVALVVAAGVYGLVGKGETKPSTGPGEVAAVAEPVNTPEAPSEVLPFLAHQEIKITECRESIVRFDESIAAMKDRLDVGQGKDGDSLEAMLGLIQNKKEKHKDLRRFQDEKINWKQDRFKKDIATYTDLIATEEGKSMKEAVWRQLVEKHPEEAEGVAAYDTKAFLNGGRLYVETVPEDAKVKVSNIEPVFFSGMKLKPGKYTLRIDRKGYLARELVVKLVAAAEKRVTVRLDSRARLTIRTEPKEARITLKGIDKRYSPGVSLQPGSYRVLVEADKYSPQEVALTLKGGEIKEESITLVAWPRLTVVTTPKNARVRIGGVDAPYSPGMKLRSGRYTVFVNADRYNQTSKSVDLAGDGNTTLPIQLEKTPVDYIFPLDGVTLGVTTVKEIAAMGVRTRSIDDNTGMPYHCYEVNGTDYWYSDDGVVDHMYITSTARVPGNLIDLGIDFTKSYSEWVDFFKRNGFHLKIKDKPKVVSGSRGRSLKAELEGLKRTPAGILVTIDLDFKYSDGQTVGSRDALYSMYIRGEKN